MLPPYFTQYEISCSTIQIESVKKASKNETISTCNYTLLIMVCSFQRLMTAMIIQLVGPTLAYY